jgi:hypothetical protein
MQGLIESTKNVTRLTEKGMTMLSGLLSSVPTEMSIPRSSIALVNSTMLFCSSSLDLLSNQE